MPDVAPVATLQRSAQDFIKSALRLVGSLRSGQNLTGDELTDCRTVLNDMLDAFSAERISIPAITRITLDSNQVLLHLNPSQQDYTLGNVKQNEDFFLPRPSRVDRVSILYTASQPTPVELPMDMYDSVQWQGLANKSITSILPQVCYVEDSLDVFPDTKLSFWPIPTQSNQVILYLWTTLTLFPDLTSQFLFPPAYSEMLRYNLALRLAAEFPCDLQKFPIVQKLAVESKGRVTGINVHGQVAVCDEAIVGSYGKTGNIFTGSANRSQRY